MNLGRLLPAFRQMFDRRGMVLMYHRVANIAADPWQLAVPPEIFQQQIDLVTQKFNVIPLSEMVAGIQGGKLKRNSLSITFDDGYADNYHYAMPLLEKYRCPACFFIATKYIGRHQMFWWDELQSIFFETATLPRSFAMHIGNDFVELQLGDDAVLNAHSVKLQQGWVYYQDPPTSRCQAYISVWKKMKPLPDEILQSTLSQIKSWANYYMEPDRLNIPLSRSQLVTMGRNPLFELGIHTVSHASLSSQTIETQHKEIAGCNDRLKSICPWSKPILSYPYGDYDLTTQAVAKNERIAGAFTTTEHTITKRSQLHALGRFHVKGWDQKEFELQLRAWQKPFWQFFQN